MRRPISEIQRHTLALQGCTFSPGCSLEISAATELPAIRNVHFSGHVSIGALNNDMGRVLRNATIHNCSIGEMCRICNVSGILSGAKIGDTVTIQNVGNIVFDPEAACGMGVEANVLDETGSRPVAIYPGLTAQIATLVSHRPKWNETEYSHMLDEWTLSSPEVLKRIQGCIGSRAVVRNVMEMHNVGVDHDVTIEGALKLVNGMVVNNLPIGTPAFAYIGYGVNAEGFIVEDGKVDNSVLLRRCYVGQGSILDKGFTAHDSLFFANCAMECGEACAIIAGPYSVSMHKSTLLIGAQMSFMNAGSGTNFSNHMYKLGPIHWGVLQRGVKTSSSAYVMWGACIGAFSLVMGQHKHHPDTSPFPFAYLFATKDGYTSVLPGAMLKSCGLARDYAKWPARDKRMEHNLPLNDNICYEVLNPRTVGAMLNAFALLSEIEDTQVQSDGNLHYGVLRFKPSAISKARHYYRMGILKYLEMKTVGNHPAPIQEGNDDWMDVGGQLLPIKQSLKLLECESKQELEDMLKNLYNSYEGLEQGWIAANIDKIKQTLSLSNHPDEFNKEIEEGARQFEKMVDTDKEEYLATYQHMQRTLSI